MTVHMLDARQIFLEAVENYAPEKWPEFLDSACRSDAELRRRVEALLQAHGQYNALLDGEGVVATLDCRVSERPGAQIGPYKLLQQIGEGGFGVVFMAEQTTPVRRKVALKVIKPGMDTRQVIARFEAERQALAVMDHPNIARVLDAGTTESGRPYFVMELVRGVAITAYCDQHSLPIRERLCLFVSVCQAIQHAHTKGIIHRDIKPSNVLVTRQEGQPLAKVIDFGIAKAIGQQLTDKTLFTEFAQMIGTPLYMSPEQAELSSADIDTRSDIYSLGVLLYELLTGTTPFGKERLLTAPYDEIRRIIREEDPPKPSTRFTTHRQPCTVSASRNSDTKHLQQVVRGELDWIVMKCLEKDRNRRYESAGVLAADVQRYLADEPVQAFPPSAWYRFGKFARRNKGVLVTAGVIATALLLALASLAGTVSVLSASNAEIKEEQQQTQRALEGQEMANDKLLDALKREQQALYWKRIALAERELAANNIGRLEEVLDECPANLRGWEWRYLRRSRHPLTFQGHDDYIFSVAFSPDGEHIASASFRDGSGEIKVWERSTGKEIHCLLGHQGPAMAVAFRPDGKQLASAGWDHTLKIWNLETGEQVTSLADHRKYLVAVAYSPDGKLLASAGGDSAVIIWDAVTLQKLRVLHSPTSGFHHIAFAPDGRRLAAGGWGESIRLWDATTGQQLHEIRGRSGLYHRVAFSRDGRTLVSAEFDGTVSFWDADSGQHRSTIHANPGIVAMALSPDGRRLATGGFERPVHIWDLETGQEALILRGHTELIHDLAFSPDGEQLASASMDGTAKVWDASGVATKSEAERMTLRGHTSAVMGVAFHPDSNRLATASSDETVRLWDMTTGAELTTLRGHTGMPAGVIFSQDGRILATGSYGGVVKIWDVESAKEIRTFRGVAASGGVALSPDGQRVAVRVEADSICIWNTETGKEELSPFPGHSGPIEGVVFSPDGQQLATASWDMSAILWDARSGQKLQTFRGHINVLMKAAFSHDGKRLATASLDKTAKVWDVATGEELLTLHGHEDRVLCVAFSPDGRLLATASSDNTARVWDAATGREIETLRGHSGYVYSVAFSQDGHWLASGGGYRRRGEVKIWDATSWGIQPER